MTSIAFIGLGVMGSPMAVNLARAGFDVVGYSRRPASADDLVESGGRRGVSVEEAVANVDVIATMLPDGPDVELVLAGPGGVFENATAGSLVVDFSTIAPQVARDLSVRAHAAGLHMVDAPVSGGEAGAIEANLSIMVGGSIEHFSALLPVLDAVGSTVVRVGTSGAGQVVKAANQLIVAGTIQLVAEAMKLLEKLQVDVPAAVTVLAGGLAGNRILDRKATAMAARDFTPGFRVELHHKDLGIVAATAREAGVPIPLGAVVSQLMAALVAQGRGDLDHGALLALLDELTDPTDRVTQ